MRMDKLWKGATNGLAAVLLITAAPVESARAQAVKPATTERLSGEGSQLQSGVTLNAGSLFARAGLPRAETEARMQRSDVVCSTDNATRTLGSRRNMRISGAISRERIHQAVNNLVDCEGRSGGTEIPAEVGRGLETALTYMLTNQQETMNLFAQENQTELARLRHSGMRVLPTGAQLINTDAALAATIQLRQIGYGTDAHNDGMPVNETYLAMTGTNPRYMNTGNPFGDLVEASGNVEGRYADSVRGTPVFRISIPWRLPSGAIQYYQFDYIADNCENVTFARIYTPPAYVPPPPVYQAPRAEFLIPYVMDVCPDNSRFPQTLGVQRRMPRGYKIAEDGNDAGQCVRDDGPRNAAIAAFFAGAILGAIANDGRGGGRRERTRHYLDERPGRDY
jgi:hypothetical protein